MSDTQLEGLKWTVRHAYEGSEFYRKRMDEASIGPDDIKTLDDLKRLPFTTAEDLRAGYPLPLLSVPADKVVRIHSSSGTTGKRKVLAYTQKDIEDWTHFFSRALKVAGVGPGSRVQIAVGYGLWTAGAGFQAACERAGAMAIPVGPGNLDLQFQFLVDLRPDTLCCTASMALLIAEEAERRGITKKIKLRRVIMGAERASEAMRRLIKDLLHLEHIYDITGMTELYGPGAGIDCSYHQGIHYWDDYYILEILDPDTLEDVEPGEVGEMVVTTLRKEATPLIRYRTRDLTRLIPGECPCGLKYPRHDRILGRSDDMFIIRGVNVYPGHVDEILSGIDAVSSEYLIEITREKGLDLMCIKVERKKGLAPDIDHDLAKEVSLRIKSSLMVSPRVEIVDYGALPRSEKKSKRVYDYRQQS